MSHGRLSDETRLAVLHDLAILDTPSEPAYDDIASLAAACCQSTIATDGGLLSLPDATMSEEWRTHPLVTGPPFLRFYAVASIFVNDEPVGVDCIFGDQPRELSAQEDQALVALARQASTASSRSTTAGATTSATACCARSPTPCARRHGTPTPWRASPVTSSSSSALG